MDFRRAGSSRKTLKVQGMCNHSYFIDEEVGVKRACTLLKTIVHCEREPEFRQLISPVTGMYRPRVSHSEPWCDFHITFEDMYCLNYLGHNGEEGNTYQL